MAETCKEIIHTFFIFDNCELLRSSKEVNLLGVYTPPVGVGSQIFPQRVCGIDMELIM